MRDVTRLLAVGVLFVALSGCGSTVATESANAPTAATPADNGLGAPVSSSAAPTTGDGVGDVTAPGGTAPSGTAPSGTAPAATGGTSAGSTTDAGPGTTTDDTGTGESADRRPIKVGIVYVNNDEGASSAGVDNDNTFTPRRVYDALVAAYNARGGFADRRITAVFVELRSSSPSLQADIQAACSKFTQDEHVAVVLGGTGLYSESFSECLTKARTPQLTGDYGLGDTQSMQQAPYLFAPASLDIETRMRAVLEHLTAAGRLTAEDRLGVVIEGCTYNQRAFRNGVVPTAKRLGLTIAAETESRCFESIGDLGGLSSDMQAAVLKFRTNDVNKVLFVSGNVEGNLMLFFATSAESQGFRPGYALSSAVIPAVQEANTPKSQLANAVGLGWLPSVDRTRAPASMPAGTRCLRDLKTGSGTTPNSAVDRAYAFTACDAFALYDAALRATLGATDATTVANAITRLGTGFASAAVYGEETDFRSGRRTGPAQGRVFAWSGDCGCFDYTGSPVRLTNR